MQTQRYRTTIDFDLPTMQELKRLAVEERTSVRKIVNKAVDRYAKGKKNKERSFEEIWAEMGRISRMGRQNMSLTKWVITDRDRRHREAVGAG